MRYAPARVQRRWFCKESRQNYVPALFILERR